MKTRESGMPPEAMWHSFFEPTSTLLQLGLTSNCKCVVDFGCGYGTFAIPAAELVSGTVHAIDIDSDMIAAARSKGSHLPNLKLVERDFVESGSGLPDGAADYVMLFNILHAQEARALLSEARRILSDDGKLAVIHWKYDPSTPRGPSMNIRLKPEDCRRLVEQAGFQTGDIIDLPPYHYGFTATPARTVARAVC